MKTICRCLFLALVSLSYLLIGPGTASAQEGQYGDKVGVSLDGLGGRGRALVDLAKTVSWMSVGGSNAAPIDDHGWPNSDAQVVLFDVRPFGTWAPPADDPDNFMPDWSGTYKMSFQGQAVIACQDSQVQFQQQKYDPAKNLTTVDLVVPKGVGFVQLTFTQTKRTADGAAGSGITMLRVLRPGVAPDTQATFSDDYVRSLKPFAVLRFMDFLETNHDPGSYSDPGHHALNWADRHVPDDATQADFGKKYGGAWEYVIELARLTGKDIWINIPIAATDDYIKSLAQLMKQYLPPKCNVYIEDSNEVWNFGFPQYTYNKLAAIDEVGQGNSKLNSDGSKDPEVWAHRRHAERLVQIGNIFRDAFGTSDSDRIRPVYASWLISAGPHFDDVFRWMEKAYGPPKDYFYALADAAYYNANGAPPNADVPTLLRTMRSNSDDNRKYRDPLQRLADHYGLKHFQYEVGPDTGGGKTDNIANRIRANRDPGIKDLILHDAQDNWFSQGGDIYIYYSHIGGYSRFGCWGLSEDVANEHPQVAGDI